MRRCTANVGVLTYEVKPMAYPCSFSGTGVVTLASPALALLWDPKETGPSD